MVAAFVVESDEPYALVLYLAIAQLQGSRSRPCRSVMNRQRRLHRS